MSDHGDIDDDLARMAIENEGNGNNLALLSDEEMEEQILNPQQIIFNLNQQHREQGLQGENNAAAVGEGLPDQPNARAQEVIQAERPADPDRRDFYQGQRNAVDAPRRQLPQQGLEYADVALGRQPHGQINAARSGQPWGRINAPFHGRQGQGNNLVAGGREAEALRRRPIQGNQAAGRRPLQDQGNPNAGGEQVQGNPVAGGRQPQNQGDPIAGGGQPQAQDGGNAARNDQSRGNRGVRAGQNQRRQARRFNPYQQDLMNVAELLVDMAQISATRTRQALAAARQSKEDEAQEYNEKN